MRLVPLLVLALCASGCGGCVDQGSPDPAGQREPTVGATVNGTARPRPGFAPIQPRFLQLATQGDAGAGAAGDP